MAYQSIDGVQYEKELLDLAKEHTTGRGEGKISKDEVVITVVKTNDEDTMTVANRLYDDLRAAGIDVLIDDRAERPGVKFIDAELIGIPFRVTVGPRGLVEGVVEFSVRSTSQKSEIAIENAAEEIAALVASSK